MKTIDSLLAEIDELRQLNGVLSDMVVTCEADAAREIDRLRAALAFARSVIKCGEPWTATCEREIDGALGVPAENAS